MDMTWGSNGGFGQNNLMTLGVKYQEAKGSAWKASVEVKLLIFCKQLFCICFASICKC